MSGCASSTAHIRAVAPVSTAAAFGSAPCRRSARTTSALPVCAAIIRGVRPLACAAFGSAPAASRRSTMPALAFSQARASGVTPWSSAAFTSAPAASSSSTISRSSQWAAHSSAVTPSARDVSASTPWSSSVRTAARSWPAAALTRRRSDVPAAAAPATSRNEINPTVTSGMRLNAMVLPPGCGPAISARPARRLLDNYRCIPPLGAHGAPRRERRGATGSPQADAGGLGRSPI